MQVPVQKTKNNFDRLAAASAMGPKMATAEQVKANLEARYAGLKDLEGQVRVLTAKLAVRMEESDKVRRLKALTAALDKFKLIHDSKLPVGTKASIKRCINEVTSLREGVFTNASIIDKKSLSLLTCAAAADEILAKAVEVKHRIDAAAEDDLSLEEFYNKAKDVIEKNSENAERVKKIANQQFVVARVPVVPADTKVSIARLENAGFKVENLGGYAVIHNQIVIGLNAKKLDPNAATMNKDALKKLLRKELKVLMNMVSQKTGKKLALVTEIANPYKSGTFFWVAPEKEIDRLAKAFPGGQAKIPRWGFAFN